MSPPRQASTVVVTGASGGIGRAVAQAFAARGDTVALLARGQKGLEGAADDVRRAGGTPVVIPIDMSDHEAVFDAAQRARLVPSIAGREDAQLGQAQLRQRSLHQRDMRVVRRIEGPAEHADAEPVQSHSRRTMKSL